VTNLADFMKEQSCLDSSNSYYECLVSAGFCTLPATLVY